MEVPLSKDLLPKKKSITQSKRNLEEWSISHTLVRWILLTSTTVHGLIVIVFSQGVLGATGARGDFGLPGADVSDFCNSCFEFLFFFFFKRKGTLLSSGYWGNHFAGRCIFRFTLCFSELIATVFYLVVFAKHVVHHLLTPKRQHKFHVTFTRRLFFLLE